MYLSGGGLNWDEASKETFASYAHAILSKLVILFSEPTLKTHKARCIVYGLHCSRDKLRIVAHLPLNVDDDAVEKWKFAQVMVAEHWIGLARANPAFPLFDDNAFLHRWRLSGALFFIRKHIMDLRELLGYASNVPNDTRWAHK